MKDVELRWVRRWIREGSMNHAERVLQYRKRVVSFSQGQAAAAGYIGPTPFVEQTEWTEWKDVPEVEE